MANPDGLGLADRYKSIYGKVPQVKKIKPVTPYAKTSASTTQYYTHKAVPKAKPKPVVRPNYSSSGGSSGGGGSYSNTNSGLATLANIAAGGGSAYQGRSQAELKKLAEQAVNIDYLPELHGLQHNVGSENQDYAALIAKLTKQLGLSKGDVSQLYAALDVNLKANAQKQKAAYATSKTAVGSSFDQLATMLNTNYTGAKNATNAELSRLGINDPNATSKLTTDQQFLQGMAGSDKANAQSVLDQLSASGQGLSSLMQGSAASSGTIMQGQLQQNFDTTKGEADVTHKKAISDLQSQINELIAGRPGKVNQTYQALLDQEYQRQMDAAQGAFDNNYKLAQLGLQQQTLSTDTAYKQNSLALDAKKLQASLDQKALAAGAPKSGLEKAMTYLQTNFKTSAIPASELQRALIDIVNGDTNTGGGRNLAGFDPRNLSEYAKDAQSYVNQRGFGNDVYTALINAMHYMFGK